MANCKNKGHVRVPPFPSKSNFGLIFLPIVEKTQIKAASERDNREKTHNPKHKFKEMGGNRNGSEL